MTPIHLLMPYFGKLPPWFALFLTSCSANPSVQFTLIGDDASFDHLMPTNFRRRPMSLSQFASTAADRISKAASIASTRKVCDFKPMLGAMFSEEVEDAVFWGYCDIDIIFGNIRRIVTEELLETCDVISTGSGFMAGHFSIFRNGETTRHLFERSKDISYVVSTDRCVVFDELGPSATWHYPGFTLGSENSIEAMTQVVLAARDAGVLKIHLGLPIVNDPDKPFSQGYSLRWTRSFGLTDTRTGGEYLYVHFQSRKGRFGFRRWMPAPRASQHQFDVSHRGFFRASGLSAYLKLLTCIFHDDVYRKASEHVHGMGAKDSITAHPAKH